MSEPRFCSLIKSRRLLPGGTGGISRRPLPEHISSVPRRVSSPAARPPPTQTRPRTRLPRRRPARWPTAPAGTRSVADCSGGDPLRPPRPRVLSRIGVTCRRSRRHPYHCAGGLRGLPRDGSRGRRSRRRSCGPSPGGGHGPAALLPLPPRPGI